MQKQAIIFDFDNTIFPVPSIGFTLFKPLFELIEEDGNHTAELDEIKDAVMRRPFQEVAEKYGFSSQLENAAIELLKTLTYSGPIQPYDDYAYAKKLPYKKFLVTTGFTKMQYSKIEAIGIAADFDQVFVVDPELTSDTKKDIFEQIMATHNLSIEEVLVVGDDPDSEIKFARQLNIETVLYDKEGRHPKATATYIINNFLQLQNLVIETGAA